MADPQSPPSPQLLFETINAYQRTGAIKAAIELEIFTRIGESSRTAAEIAASCECPERGIRILCDNLAMIGFLGKSHDRYSLTPDSAVFLDQNSPAYLGGMLPFLLNPAISGAFDDLASTIRTGRLHTSEHGTTAPDHPVWIEFARAMGPMMVPTAHGAAELVTLDADRDTRILDISASHGLFGIAFAKRNPRARLVALDWEPVLSVTRQNAVEAGIADRFETIGGDAFTVDLEGDYDLALVPNFLHHFNVSDCVRFLKRIHAALRPGGRVLIIEFVPEDDRITPPEVASFSLVMLGSTPEGDAYSKSEYQRMLSEAGFRDVEVRSIVPTPQSAVIAVA
ncbi:MAG: methyltransferase domain-containing protein [Verrucomicrobiae bacterium]|nr:methyltransferase domain-containing protein [Verrucomicrobiae bacterium]